MQVIFPFYQAPTLIERQRVQMVLPEFLLAAPAWSGASTLLQEYQISNDYSFSLLLPIAAFGANFVAAIRWMEETDVYVRYKLFDHEDAVLNYPVYNGERIGPNAVLELWSVDSADAPELEDDYTFYTSRLVFPSTEASYCGSCCANPSSVITLAATAASELPPGADCNPFCGTLCNTPNPMPDCDCPTQIVENCEDGRDYNPAVFISPAMLITLGGLTKGDGLGKMFYWDSTSLAVDTADETTTVIRPSSIGLLSPGRWLQYI